MGRWFCFSVPLLRGLSGEFGSGGSCNLMSNSHAREGVRDIGGKMSGGAIRFYSTLFSMACARGISGYSFDLIILGEG